MLLAILVVIPSLLATWVSYWSTNLFASLSNRPGRITSLIVPLPIAVATATIFTASDTDLQLPDLTGKYVAASLLLALTALLILVTLLLALIAAKLFTQRTPPQN